MNIKCKNRAALRHFGNYIWAASLETANGWLRVSADSRALRKMVANARSCLLLWLFFLPDKSCSFSGHILAWLAGWVFHFVILEKGPHSVIQTGFRLSPTPCLSLPIAEIMMISHPAQQYQVCSWLLAPSTAFPTVQIEQASAIGKQHLPT